MLLELANSGVQITLACDIRLVDLFSCSFNFLTVIVKDPDNRYQNLEPTLDYYLAIGSLPKFYQNDIKDFEVYQPYLKADETLLSK